MSPTDFKETTAGRHVGLHGKVAGGSPLAVIENVEGFGSQLKAHRFAKTDDLGHRKVNPFG